MSSLLVDIMFICIPFLSSFSDLPLVLKDFKELDKADLVSRLVQDFLGNVRNVFYIMHIKLICSQRKELVYNHKQFSGHQY